MKARFIQEIGIRGELRIYWDHIKVIKVEPCSDGTCAGGVHVSTQYQNSCPNTYGSGRPGIHNAYTHLSDVLNKRRVDFTAEELFGKEADYAEERWPTKCRDCGAAVEVDNESTLLTLGAEGFMARRQVRADRLYNTPSGDPEPGDVFRQTYKNVADHFCEWDNCDGQHFVGVLPNGHHWDVMSRASNCTMRDDKKHRCWVAHGTPEEGNLHVDKAGLTCNAGAGSIAVPGWHGFLHNFSWNG